ncbi:hypothetical protein ACIHDR_08330 [Nocardia sp. NPDC052278]|uniref:hypothetical protein n=1 Tax=unclassified Nocardia TaxID=2637762 RepID=UPI0036A22A5C
MTARGPHTVHLFDEMRVAACSTRSPLAGHERLEWTELADWPLVVDIVRWSRWITTIAAADNYWRS